MVSEATTAEAVASVSVTILPAIAGAVLPSVCVASEPPAGVFFTVNALFARLAAAARSSLKTSTRFVSAACADTRRGAAASTVWSDNAGCARWPRPALICSAGSVCLNLMVPPFRSTLSAAHARPSWSSSPAATV